MNAIPRKRSFRRVANSRTMALGAGLLAIAALLLLGELRGSRGEVTGDEGTYLAMAASLAYDADLRFGPEDRARLEAAKGPARKTVILQRAGDRVAYSKPALYPILAAPFYRFMGEAGPVALNVLVLALALLAAWRALRPLGEAGPAAWTLVTFAATGVMLPYAAWAMSDALQVALSLAGLSLCLAAARPGDSTAEGRLPALLGGALLGLLIPLRPPNALLAAAAVAVPLLSRRRGRAFLIAAAVLAAFALSTLADRGLTGAASPYRAERATFTAGTGYPAGEGGEQAMAQFRSGRATHVTSLKARWQPVRTAYSALYFLAGRHTGVLIYFPAALLLAAAALRRPDRRTLILIAAAAGISLFYLIWLPGNYFGGGAFLGNRYFLVAYPALLLALPRPPSGRTLAAAWAIAAAVFGSALASEWRDRPLAYASQSHASAGLFRLLPAESTADDLDGRADRHWSDELVRFFDRNAEVSQRGVRLTAGAPPAEIMIAGPREHGVLRFVVRSQSPSVRLRYRDWRRSETLKLGPREDGARGMVEIAAAPAWRRHPFRWRPGESWSAWLFRIEAQTPGDPHGEVDLRYLGPYRLAPKFFAARALAVELPSQGVAGTRTEIALHLGNRGSRAWASQADVPVHLVHRLRPLDRPGARTLEKLSPLPHAVAAGGEVMATVRVRWPRRPGRYLLELDLMIGGAVSFADWVGAPLAAGEVRVLPAQD